MTLSRPSGWIAALLVALGLFSLGFSLLAERGLWPELPPGALHDTDLAAGFAVVSGVIWLLWKGEDAPHTPGSVAPGEGSVLGMKMMTEDPQQGTEPLE